MCLRKTIEHETGILFDVLHSSKGSLSFFWMSSAKMFKNTQKKLSKKQKQ